MNLYEICQKQIEKLIYERDRYKMNGDASASLAEYRMRRIFELEKRLEHEKKVTNDLYVALEEFKAQNLEFRRQLQHAEEMWKVMPS